MMARTELHGLRCQTGAVGLLTALFLIMAVLVMGQALLRQSASGANDSLLTQDGVDALFLAESGLERAAAQLSAGSATCDASLAGSSSYAGGTVAIANLGAGFSTDFDGSALGTGECRVRATGSAGLFGAQRTVEAILATATDNLLGTYADFNDTTCILYVFFCRPTGWTINPFNTGWSNTGGPDGTRAAQVNKTGSFGTQTTTADLDALVPFTVTAPTTLTVHYDYQVISAGQTASVMVRLSSGATPYTATVSYGPTTGFQNGSLAIAIPGSGPITIDGFHLTLTASAGQPKTLLIDNLELAGGGGGGGVVRWREIIN